MTESEVKRVAEDAAEGALRKFLLVLGVDVSTYPATIELQRDFHHLRHSRVTMGAVGNRILMALTGSVVTGIAAAVLYYVTHGGH